MFVKFTWYLQQVGKSEFMKISVESLLEFGDNYQYNDKVRKNYK